MSLSFYYNLKFTLRARVWKSARDSGGPWVLGSQEDSCNSVGTILALLVNTSGFSEPISLQPAVWLVLLGNILTASLVEIVEIQCSDWLRSWCCYASSHMNILSSDGSNFTEIHVIECRHCYICFSKNISHCINRQLLYIENDRHFKYNLNPY